MGDWALSACERQEFSTGVASRGAANAKGAYVQLIAATGFDYSALTVQLVGTGGGGQCYLVDIAIGAAGSEVVIAPNILLDTARGGYQNVISLPLPLAIPIGARLAARVQEAGGTGSRTVQVTLIGRAGGVNTPSATCGSVNNYGANTATSSGVLVDPGATLNIYGAWAEIVGATVRSHAGIIAVLGTEQFAPSMIDTIYYLQIGIGASGSETILCEFMSAISSGANRLHENLFDIAAALPEGTRIAMRSKCVLSAVAAARHVTAVILGY